MSEKFNLVLLKCIIINQLEIIYYKQFRLIKYIVIYKKQKYNY